MVSARNNNNNSATVPESPHIARFRILPCPDSARKIAYVLGWQVVRKITPGVSRSKGSPVSPHICGVNTEGGKPSETRMDSDKKGKTSRECS